MEKGKIKERVITLIGEHTRRKTVISEETILSNLNFDSLDEVEILIECEKEFNIVIEDEDWAQIRNVGDIIEIISNLKTD